MSDRIRVKSLPLGSSTGEGRFWAEVDGEKVGEGRRAFWETRQQARDWGSLHWSGFEADYRPRSAEALAASRDRRQRKALLKEADGSLFSEQIIAEGVLPKGRGR